MRCLSGRFDAASENDRGRRVSHAERFVGADAMLFRFALPILALSARRLPVRGGDRIEHRLRV